MVLAFAGTLIYASMYVLSERMFAVSTIQPETTAFYMGAYCTVACILYQVVYTLPNWDQVVTRRYEKKVDRTRMQGWTKSRKRIGRVGVGRGCWAGQSLGSGPGG